MIAMSIPVQRQYRDLQSAERSTSWSTNVHRPQRRKPKALMKHHVRCNRNRRFALRRKIRQSHRSQLAMAGCSRASRQMSRVWEEEIRGGGGRWRKWTTAKVMTWMRESARLLHGGGTV